MMLNKVTILQINHTILKQCGVDDFEQFGHLIWSPKKEVTLRCHLNCQNCEETAFFCYLASREMKKDEGLSRRKLRVRVSSTPHPKASVNSGAFLVVRSDDYAIISPSLIYVLSYISV